VPQPLLLSVRRRATPHRTARATQHEAFSSAFHIYITPGVFFVSSFIRFSQVNQPP